MCCYKRNPRLEVHKYETGEDVTVQGETYTVYEVINIEGREPQYKIYQGRKVKTVFESEITVKEYAFVNR